MKRTTIKDIAKYLDINVSTVSRALRDQPQVSESLRKKVQETAKLLNYVPNNTARNFRSNQTETIALILPELGMHFIPSVIRGISDKLKKNGKQLMILLSEDSYEIEKENISKCCNLGVDGILIALAAETEDIEHLAIASKLQIPTVIFDKSVKQNIYDEVIIDDYKVVKNICQYFKEKNAQNVLGVFGCDNLSITKKRQSAFEDFMNEHSINYEIIHTENAVEAKSFSSKKLSENNFDSIFAMSDETLFGPYIHLLEKNMINNYTIAAISSGELPLDFSSNTKIVTHSGYELGQLAIKVLLKRINNPVKEIIPKTYYSNIY